jgi:hypothetical protein
VEKVKSLAEELRKRSMGGDGVEDAGDTQRKLELDFSRNQDFAGNEKSLSTDADFSRGSGFIGGKLVGEGEEGSSEENPIVTRPEGLGTSANQERTMEAIRREQESSGGDWSASPMDTEQEEARGRDVVRPSQTTGEQRFGRDVGASGLDQEDREERGMGPGKGANEEQKAWAAVLRRLGGGSPGSEENLQLLERFSRMQFPAEKETVLSRLEPGAEFRIREGVAVDLRQALDHSRSKVFRNPNELVDCVKDELRRQEAAGVKLLKPA